MKRITGSAVIFTALFLGIMLIAPVGCAKKTGIQRSEKTTSSMQAVESDIRETVAQIDTTNASLNHVLASKDSPDVRKAYDAFSDNVSKMNKSGNALLKDTTEMTARGNDYFEEWQKTGTAYTNPKIQQLSQERRNQLQQTFSQISQSSMGVTGHLNSYLSNLKQIQQYLGTDLTPTGISNIASVAQSTMATGNRVKDSVQPMLSATAQARSQLSEGAAAGGTSQGSASEGSVSEGSTTDSSGGYGQQNP